MLGHMPLRRVRAPLAVVLLLVLTVTACGDPQREGAPGAGKGAPAAAGGKPSPASTDVDLPVGLPIQLDGRMPPGEWEAAAQKAIGEDGSVLRFQQVRGTLLLSLASPSVWREGGSVTFYFAPDGPDSSAYSDGAVTLNFEPFEHNRPHLLASRYVQRSQEGDTGHAVARADLRGGRTALEVAVDLTLLGVNADSAPPLRFAVIWGRGSGTSPWTWPPGLDLQSDPGRAPRDLATTSHWGRLFGWVDPAGPGAFSTTAWEHMVGEDAELYRRGNTAHGAVLLIAEEPTLEKVDSQVVPELVDNLRWIAEREPLSPNDLLALARGYRFLNRCPEALALLDSLQSHPGWRQGERMLYDRALTLEAMERYPEAATAWSQLADVAQGPNKDRYRAMVDLARSRQAGWQAEQDARAADAVRSDLPLVLLRTNRGDVLVQLDKDDVPKAVEHFLSLVERKEDGKGFYDGTAFHRVVGGYLAQGGDPASRDGRCEDAGAGEGPETIPVETNPRHGFYRGAVGFARGLAYVNGCQFFILVGPRPELKDQTYTCFGHVVSGMEVVDRIERCDRLLEARVLR
jgi:cyclophilin family peptidyl-prolyl cis-trans isomerase